MDGSALIGAVQANDIQRVRELLRSGGVDVNAGDDSGATALHWAAVDGFLECVQVCCVVVCTHGLDHYANVLFVIVVGVGGQSKLGCKRRHGMDTAHLCYGQRS